MQGLGITGSTRWKRQVHKPGDGPAEFRYLRAPNLAMGDASGDQLGLIYPIVSRMLAYSLSSPVATQTARSGSRHRA